MKKPAGAAGAAAIEKPPFALRLKRDMRANWSIYLMALPFLAYFIIFHYIPMGGVPLFFSQIRHNAYCPALLFAFFLHFAICLL